jgi:hypothetical protein
LFNAYIKQQHFKVTENLPSRECLRADLKNASLDFAFVKGEYVQPEMKAREPVFPENMSEGQRSALGFNNESRYATPLNVSQSQEDVQNESVFVGEQSSLLRQG